MAAAAATAPEGPDPGRGDSADERFPYRLRVQVVVGLLRYYMSEHLYYQAAEDNPHGPFLLNEVLLQRLPKDGTLQDVAEGVISRGDAEDVEADETVFEKEVFEYWHVVKRLKKEGKQRKVCEDL